MMKTKIHPVMSCTAFTVYQIALGDFATDLHHTNRKRHTKGDRCQKPSKLNSKLFQIGHLGCQWIKISIESASIGDKSVKKINMKLTSEP